MMPWNQHECWVLAFQSATCSPVCSPAFHLLPPLMRDQSARHEAVISAQVLLLLRVEMRKPPTPARVDGLLGATSDNTGKVLVAPLRVIMPSPAKLHIAMYVNAAGV
jgi:hypothetical protein